MRHVPVSFLFLCLPVAAQQVVLAPIPFPGAMLISSDTRGGAYGTLFNGHEPMIVHFTAAGELRTIVTEESVLGEHPHDGEEGEYALLHSPGELWLSGDGDRLVFPVYRHVHPWHLTDVMMLRDGKISGLLTIDQKLTYTLGGRTFDRYTINSRKAAVTFDRFHLFSFLSSYTAEQIGNQQLGQLTPALFAYRPGVEGGSPEVTAYLDLDLEDGESSVIEPGCMSRFNYLFGLGTPAVTFFQPPSFALLHIDPQGLRRTLAEGVRLAQGAFACGDREASVIYRDSGGATRFVTTVDGNSPRPFFEGNSIEGYPVGEITHHNLSATGRHLFLMKTPDGRQGVFAVEPDGSTATVLEPGFAGTGRAVKSLIVSAERLFFLTDAANAPVAAVYRPKLAQETIRTAIGAPLEIICQDCPPIPQGLELTVSGRKLPFALTNGKLTVANPDLSVGRYEATLQVFSAKLPFAVEVTQ